MAKKLLISDNKLGWIKDTRSDNPVATVIPKPADLPKPIDPPKPADARKSAAVKKPAAARNSPKEEKPSIAVAAAAVTAPKKHAQPKAAAAAKTIGPGSKSVSVKTSQPKAAQKTASALKRPLATIQSPAKAPSIKAMGNKPQEKKKAKPSRPSKSMIPPYHAALQPLESNLGNSIAVTTKTMPPTKPERLMDEPVIPVKELFSWDEETAGRKETPTPPEKEVSTPAGKAFITAPSNPPEKGIYSRILYLMLIAALISATVFLPERYSLFVFCGFILIGIIEVSFRVAEHLRLLKMMKENRNGWMELLRKR